MLTRAVLLCALAASLLAGPAQAARVTQIDSTTLRYQAEGAVNDSVRMSLVDGGTNILFQIGVNPAQPVTTSSPCVINAPSTTDVKCPRGSIQRIVYDLGEGDDSLNDFGAASEIPIRLEALGGPGDDSLRGGSVGDSLSGGDGNDFLYGRGGPDDLRGGNGFDQLSYCCSANPVKVSLDDVANDGINGTEGDNARSDIEDLTGGAGDDELTGNDRGNVLDGYTGNDRLTGAGGTDDFIADDGNDVIFARDGEGERVRCGEGNDTVTADDTDEAADCETVNASGELVRDLDGDGVAKPDDCDDANPAIRPGLADTPDDGVDQDCSGSDATNLDRDGDGSPRPFDCNDADRSIRVGAREVFGNRVDEDCDGRADPLQTLQTPVLSRFVAGSRATSIRRLVAERLDAGTRVELACSGKRCPFKTRAFDLAQPAKSLNLRTRAKLRSLRGTVTLDVRILREDSIGRVYRYRFRNRRIPRTQILCQAPSDPKPRAC